MLYCLNDDIVTVLESCITVGFMFALAFIAFAFDKLNATRKEKLFADATGTNKKVANEDDPTAFKPPIPFKAGDVYEHLIPEEKGINWISE